MSGHTPGPWDASGLTVYDTCLDEVASTHTAADARLIAAAPDLLEALADLFERGEVHVALAGNPIACEQLEAKCRAAIAKARGGQA